MLAQASAQLRKEVTILRIELKESKNIFELTSNFMLA
jgi:hypothetical protein